MGTFPLKKAVTAKINPTNRLFSDRIILHIGASIGLFPDEADAKKTPA